jgi:hypothetical protein
MTQCGRALHELGIEIIGANTVEQEEHMPSATLHPTGLHPVMARKISAGRLWGEKRASGAFSVRLRPIMQPAEIVVASQTPIRNQIEKLDWPSPSPRWISNQDISNWTRHGNVGPLSGQKYPVRIHFCHMSSTVTVRLPEDLAAWLRENARRRGLSQSQIIKDHLEKARNGAPSRAFMSLAGTIDGAKDLSQRRGFKRP